MIQWRTLNADVNARIDLYYDDNSNDNSNGYDGTLIVAGLKPEEKGNTSNASNGVTENRCQRTIVSNIRENYSLTPIFTDGKT